MTEPTDEAETLEELQRKASDLANRDLSRRKMLAASGVGAAAGLSGCSGLGGGATPTPRVIERERTVIKEKTVQLTPEPEPADYVVTSHMYVTSDIDDFQHTHFAASCAPQYQYVAGQTIGFRVGIWDPETGEQLTNDDVDAVTISIDGPASYGPLELEWNGDDEEHPADQWSVSWRNTDDAPPGEYTYTISITDSDSDAEFRNLGLWENTFSILDPADVPTATATPTPSDES